MQQDSQGYTDSDWPRDVREYHARYRDAERIKYLPYRPDLVVLDGRCGQGVLLDQFDGWAGAAWGIDHPPAALIPNLHPHRVASAALDALPFAGGTFDGVLYQGMLRQVADPRYALFEIARVLRLGGRLILWESRPALCRDEGANLETALGEAGFAPICREPFDYLAYPAAVLLGWISLLRRSVPAVRAVQVMFALDALLARLPALQSSSWHTIVSLEKRYARSPNA